MAMAVAISPGIFIFLLYLQNTLAQQYLNNVGYKDSSGYAQQNIQKSTCGYNQISQNGLNIKSLQQGNPQQVNYQQSNIQQSPYTQQASTQTQLNSQQGPSQQPVNSISNSQLLKQTNQDLASNIFSTLYNIQQSSQNQRGIRNIVKENPPQQINYEQLTSSQNQPNPTFTVPTPTNKLQNNQPSMSNSYVESPQFQPSFTFQFVPNNNIQQPNQQMYALPVHKVSTNDQSQSYSTQSYPITNSMTSHQATEMQNPMVMIPGSPTKTVQSQPIVLTLQSPQASSVQNQPTISTSQPSQNQPIIYTVKTQPLSESNQNQKIPEVPSQKQIMNYPMDKQTLMSYVMSQLQSPEGSSNALASILPAILNTKSEKSSSMKALLPLIFNILNEKKSCCPHCGYNAANNNQPNPEPIVNTGYSNHVNYSQKKRTDKDQKTTEEVSAKMTKSSDLTSNDANQEKSKDVEVFNNSAEISEEEEEANDSEEEYYEE